MIEDWNIIKWSDKMSDEIDPIKPHESHQWKEDKSQTRCINCGAYKHLSSGFSPCTAEPRKKPLTTLFRNNHETPEGKYLVKRRDGTVVEWPNFVLGAKDPIAAIALQAYANEVARIIKEEPDKAKQLGLTREFCLDLCNEVYKWNVYRTEHGTGDPGMGRHRKDDPATIAEMRKGRAS